SMRLASIRSATCREKRGSGERGNPAGADTSLRGWVPFAGLIPTHMLEENPVGRFVLLAKVRAKIGPVDNQHELGTHLKGIHGLLRDDHPPRLAEDLLSGRVNLKVERFSHVPPKRVTPRRRDAAPE